MPKAHRPKKSDSDKSDTAKPDTQKSKATNPETPDRDDLEAEIPQAPAQEPSAEPTAIGGTRGPRPTVEPEVE
ncbi:MAG TPA: hypothetical protein VIV11_33290 [Kofleriaceae bacterium]